MSIETTDAPLAAPEAAANPTVNPLERQIDITLTKANIDADVAVRLKNIAKNVRMPGFRPGKVPMHIVAQQYGSEAHSEALSAGVQAAFSAQVAAQQLRIAGYPQIAMKPMSDEAYQFTATFEVLPEVVIGDLSKQQIVKAVLVVSSADVDKTLDQLRRQRATYEPTHNPAAKEDRIIIDFTGRKEGKEFEGGSAKDFTVQLGAGRMIPDFENALYGLTAEQNKTFEANFPADYPAAELAGQSVQFEVHVKSVTTPKLPEIDADFAKDLGVRDGDITKLHTEVRENLEREVKKRLQARLTRQVMDALLAVCQLDAPQTLIAAESKQLMANARRNLEQRNINPDTMPLSPELFKESALRRVKLGLIMAELTQKMDLEAKPEQVRAMIQEYATTFENPQEVVRWYFEKPERMSEANALATENNVTDWALTQAIVTEKPISLEELMGEDQAL